VFPATTTPTILVGAIIEPTMTVASTIARSFPFIVHPPTDQLVSALQGEQGDAAV
jgi:hypothetical protein